MSKSLVVYYSYSNTTKSLAEEISILTDSDIRELVVKEPYSFSYHGATKKVRNETEGEFCPKLAFGDEPVADYEYIFIGTPNWFKSYAPPIRGFLRNVDLDGKTIIPFCTHGGGGFGQIENDIAKECPNSNLRQGFASTGAVGEQALQDWLDRLGLSK